MGICRSLLSKKRTASAGGKGKDAEQRAKRWLRRQRCRIVEENYHCRLGEIDLIVRDGPVLAFIEVRARKSDAWGGAAASVDRKKQQKIRLCAEHYIASHRQAQDLPCRFDVVAFEGENDPVWIKNAFC